MKLSILIPQYNEDDKILKRMLDSIALQQNIDFNEIEVVITNDGSDTHLSDSLITSYPFKIHYYLNKHCGVSATRNYCFDHSNGDYVMFCDADDMFFNACGLWMVFREIDNGGFDSFVSNFVEETRMPSTKEVMYINHEMDSTFVHGKIHKRKYLLEQNIRWNDNLTIHEDSYFNCLCQKLSTNVKYCPTAFYLWRWRDESVCRNDFKYILKTYNNMLDSNTALVQEFINRNRLDCAQFYSTAMIYDAYYTMNKDEWINQENKEYRDATEKRFKIYYETYKSLFQTISPQQKQQIIVSIRNRFFQEGMFLEKVTFDDWIKHIETLK